MSNNISYILENISYKDTEDHFNNGFLRLLNIDNNFFNQWIMLANTIDGDLINKLSNSFKQLKSLLTNISNLLVESEFNKQGQIWYTITENYFIIKSVDNSIAWLAKKNSNKLIRELNPPIYEEDYFEGDLNISGGYGQYTQQSNWRISKALRQVEEIKSITKLSSGKFLDIGSGYGYFRFALNQNNFEHDGIEISNHACQITKSLYGYNNYVGTLNMYCDQLISQYDCITMWDVIEHISNPIEFLFNAYKCLKPNGFLIIKTPNINCPEIDIFGSYYHSFKREHLIYFSKESLINFAEKVGFKTYYSTSISHLLIGFFGEEIINKWANECKGSDLIMYFKK
jgi:2-polyprenyl-3-methyl-5-hydroxy-6-metoxy-1,4-benzoquinol methylase